MDIYPYLGIAAMNTEKVEMGPFVTNPLTRHPSVTASAMATIDTLSDGRAFLGLGRGDSAVKMLGWRPAKWKEYEQSIHDMRSWMRGDPVEVEGAPGPVALSWADREVPIVMSLFGPRGAKLAGRLADRATTECAVSVLSSGSTRTFRRPQRKQDGIPFHLRSALARMFRMTWKRLATGAAGSRRSSRI